MRKWGYIIFILIAVLFNTTVVGKNKEEVKKITADFENMPTRQAIKWLAKFQHHNVIVSNAVKGKVDLHLKNVSWKEAMKIILTSQGLGEKREGNLIYITPLGEMAQFNQQRKIADKNSPMQTKLIHLNYANAEELAKLLKNGNQSLLSKNGQVAVDKRTNSIIIQDPKEQISTLLQFIKRLDIPVPQVAIETRIVNIDDDYEKDLGVRFGLTSGRHMSGSLKGANEIAGVKLIPKVNPEDRLNVDLPAQAAHAGRLGLALFKLSQGTLLDLELSAMESEGRAEIISNPRLITVNQRPATIEAGEEIPYQEAASVQGATKTSFKKAVLSLQVTPQITPNKKVLLHLKVNQDKRSSNEVKGVPTIDTRQITTQVLVNNGQTVVLGGIYEQTRINGEERVPFFSDLPGIGVLFRRNKQVNNRRELLIFVTPNIVEQT